MLGNELFWAHYIRGVFIEETRTFGQTLKNRILKAFGNIEQEAEELKEKEYKRLLQTPVGENGGPGMDELAERAEEEGINFYITMTNLQQGIVNMFAVALYGLFTQQLMLFHRRELLGIHEENDQELFTPDEVKRRLCENGIDIEKFRSYGKIRELKLVANTVKHAEGWAAKDLRNIRPDLFISPHSILLKPRSTLFKPLLGEDFFVTSDDIVSYTDAIEEFWEELADALKKHARSS